MSTKNEQLASKIKQNRLYLKEAKTALAEVRKTLQNGANSEFRASNDRDIAIDHELPANEEEAGSNDLGRFVSTRNGKGWLKMRI